jgi:hypothetical protein
MTAHVHVSGAAGRLLLWRSRLHTGHTGCLHPGRHGRAFHTHLAAFGQQEVSRNLQRLSVDLHQHVVHHAG